jgi:tripartite-type tricarboxylate transporter receptor subunit TctC
VALDKLLTILCAGLLLALPCCEAMAQAASTRSGQSYLARPIRFVVPYAPGGPLDIMARAIGQKLTESMGQPVVVDNKPGAGGNIGADIVAKAAPDGYTIVMGAVATHAINPTLYPSIPYDPVRDFTPVAMVAVVPNVLVVNPALPVKNVKDLIALARTKPATLNFGSGSTGSTGHLAGELFNALAGVQMVHIPYKGGAPAMADLLAGQVQLMFDNLANALPQVRAGRLRALAVTTAQRSAFAPELPTLVEAGVPGFDLTTWFGVFLPGNTPRDIVTRLNSEINKALAAPDMKDRLEKMGAEAPANNTPERFAAFIKVEFDKYARVIKASGAKVE